MIDVDNLVKRYGAHTAVSDVSFRVGKGDVVGFLGPNGAGKSTTLRILAGFLGLTSGKVKVAGFDVVEESFEARKRIGYMPEAVPLYPEMRVVEYLTFRAELKGVARDQRKRNVDVAMEKTNVSDRATTLIGNLSKGYKQRVGLADALVADPPLLILDEPTAGLDPNQIRDVRAVIADLGKDHTVLLSTHILSEVESSCSRVVVIAKGKLVADGKVSELRRLRRSPAVALRLRGDGARAEAIIRAIEGVTGVSIAREGEGFTLTAAWSKKLDVASIDAATEHAVKEIVLAGLYVRAVEPVESTLEEVFAELTGQRIQTTTDADEEDDEDAEDDEEEDE